MTQLAKKKRKVNFVLQSHIMDAFPNEGSTIVAAFKRFKITEKNLNQAVSKIGPTLANLYTADIVKSLQESIEEPINE